ncbi:MAG: hypothetical protein IT395_05050 [Candidatus Omnitrophica bacterium]|nr:hypothetical protein [Candidatus Omnitrophota bacterium]
MNKKISVVLAALLLSPLAFLSVADAKPNLAAKFYLEQGKKEFKNKEYDLAIKEFNKALLADPENEEALMYLKMLGFGGKASSTREQEPVAKTEEKVEEKTKDQIKDKEEKAENKAEKKSVKKTDTVKPKVEKTASLVEASEAEDTEEEDSEAEDMDAQDHVLQDIEDQIAAEEAAALKALHEQAAKDQVALLKKLDQVEKKTETPAAVPSKTKAPKKESKADAVKKSLAAEAKKSSVAQKTEPKPADVEDIAAEDDQAVIEAVEDKPEASVSAREAAAVASVKKNTSREISDYQSKIEAQTAQKIEKVHNKFAAKPIGEKEKTVFRDFDNDGVPEAISVNENKAIEKIEAAAKKEEQAGIKKIQKQGQQDEKTALKNLRALIKKEEKMQRRDQKTGDLKAGDVVGSPALSATVHDDEADELAAAEGVSGSEKENAALAQMRADVARKEKDLEMKYAKKKAIRMSEAEKKSKPQVQEPKVSLTDTDESYPADLAQQTEVFPVGQNISVTNPKSVQAQNIVLKKKFAQVVEMSQKDQDLIKGLEKDLEQKDQKVEALESDLHETKTTLDSKVEMIKEKEEKLKDLSQRIAAMESDVNSKQYDFKDKQMEYEKKLQAIQEEFGNYKTERTNSEEELRGQLKILKEALEKKIAEFNAAQEKLIFTENKLKNSEEKYAQTTKQYDDVKKTLSDLEDRLAGLMAQPAPVIDQAPLVTVDPKNLPPPQNQNEVVYQQWIQRQDQLVTKLKNKLLWAREQMEFLGRYDIKLSDQKMAALKEQLVEVKKQLSTKVPSGRTDEDFAVMDARLKDSQERLEMVEKILREKDDQVKELEKQLNEVLSAF